MFGLIVYFFIIIFIKNIQVYSLSYDDIKNKYDIDNTFCQIKINGSSMNYTTTNDISKNLTLVLAGNAYKYNLSCNVNDKNYHIGDKHYIIDLILYGPVRQLKAWRLTLNTTKNNHDDIVDNELTKQMSFGWIGQSRLLCIVKKYNYVLNKFTRCEQNLFLNVKEKHQPQLIAAALSKFLIQNNYKQAITTRKSSSSSSSSLSSLSSSIIIQTISTTKTTTIIIDKINDSEVTEIDVNNNNNIIKKSDTNIKQYSNNSSFQAIIIITIFLFIFLSVIMIVVYVTYCRNSASYTIKHFKKTKFKPIDTNDGPLCNIISSKTSDSGNLSGTETTVSLDKEKLDIIDNSKESSYTLDSISSRCSRYIDEKDKSKLNDDSTKFI